MKLWIMIAAVGFLHAQAPQLDAAARRRVIEGAIANIEKYYDYPEVGKKVADALLAHEKNGDNVVADGQAFADLLTKQMKDVSHDGQLKMRYSASPTTDRPPQPRTPEMLARYKKALEENHCFFEKVEILPHNIGYVKLDGFADPSFCEEKVAAEMASLNNADAIIIDLHDNTGGYPKMVALVASYLFEHPTHLNDMYDRGQNSTEESWTLSPVAGNKVADKPAYVLTSSKTFSAGEEFIYGLKMLKRATIVGEATSGASHIPMGRRIDDHFEIRVPDRRPINPISKTNWEGPGVQPDVRVKAADALETAEKLVLSGIEKK